MLFDTHCHLTIDSLYKRHDEIISSAGREGVTHFVVPGVDIKTSEKASELSILHPQVYAAVGLHPEIITDENKFDIPTEAKKVEQLLGNKKIVAIGEVGLDRYMYAHYLRIEDNQKIERLINEQTILLREQVQLGLKYDLSVILHSRDTATDMVNTLGSVWDAQLTHRTVFHCCEPSADLLEFAKQHGVFIGVDGDVTWSKKKQRFIKEVPLELLVLETDSPYLTPQQVKSKEIVVNEPKNIVYVRDAVATIKGLGREEVEKMTTENARRLFRI